MEEITLIIGCTWDFEQLDLIIELNKKYQDRKIRVSELYGSLRSSYIPLPSARPDYRIPNVSLAHFKKYVAKARDNHIGINYACNGTLIDGVKQLHKKKGIFGDTFKMLEDVGVSRLMFSNPLLIEIAKEYCTVPIDISTIFHPTFIANLPIYAEWNVDKVHMNIYLNRDIQFLKKYNDAAKKYNIRPCLLANEFCMFGLSPCSGIMRDACYNCSTAGGNEKDYFSNWPFARCHNARRGNPVAWLIACFILPQHLKFYKEQTGISNFKITGRTNPVEHVTFLIKTYLSENYQGKIVNLWVDPGKPAKSLIEEQFNIEVSELEDVDFFSRWFSRKYPPCDFSCGLNCTWCKDKYKEILGRRHTNVR
jgi:hypothetical protein